VNEHGGEMNDEMNAAMNDENLVYVSVVTMSGVGDVHDEVDLMMNLVGRNLKEKLLVPF
jgi:hypothetical protein